MHNNLLEPGITGLANTPNLHPQLWFHGHHGAAVLAAHFMLQDVSLAADVKTAVAAAARQTMEANGPLFTAAEDDAPAVDFAPVAEEIDRHIGTLTADGHDVIFASLALRAFHQQPSLATEARVNGIITLIQQAQNDNPQRYYGYDDYINEPVDYGDVPQFANLQEAVDHALADHEVVYPDQTVHGRHYFLAGNKLHDITHAHALVELQALGYTSTAAKGLDALRKQFHLCDTSRLPSNLQPCTSNELLDPWTLPFWQRGKHDAHQIKLAHAVMSLLQHTAPARRSEILRQVSKYWVLLP